MILVVRGRYVDHTFIPDGQLPDVEGPAELIITQTQSLPSTSVFELFGKAARLRTAEDISRQLEAERNEWDEP